jgi:hypothetical protein
MDTVLDVVKQEVDRIVIEFALSSITSLTWEMAERDAKKMHVAVNKDLPT